MKNTLKIPLLLVYVVALIALYIFSVDKYSWMQEMDTSLPSGAINNDGSSFSDLATLTFIFILAMQVLFFFKEKQKKWKIIAVALSLIAAAMYIAGHLRLL